MKSLLLSVEPPPEPYTLTAHIYTLTAHIYTLTAQKKYRFSGICRRRDGE